MTLTFLIGLIVLVLSFWVGGEFIEKYLDTTKGKIGCYLKTLFDWETTV